MAALWQRDNGLEEVGAKWRGFQNVEMRISLADVRLRTTSWRNGVLIAILVRKVCPAEVLQAYNRLHREVWSHRFLRTPYWYCTTQKKNKI